MAIEQFQPLLSLSGFKGIDTTSAGIEVKPGFATFVSNANPTITPGALVAERGRVAGQDFSSVLASISVVVEGIGYGAGITGTPAVPIYVVGGLTSGGAFAAFLYIPSTGSIRAISNSSFFDQAVQYGGVMYFNNGMRLFLGNSIGPLTMLLWQYPPPAAAGNITLADSGSGTQVATTITSPIVAGSTTFTVASGTGINNGDRLVLDVGAVQEIVTVTISGTTVTVTNSFVAETGVTAAAIQFNHDTGAGVWEGLDAEQYYYVITYAPCSQPAVGGGVPPVMPDGSTSETSVDLAQFASPPGLDLMTAGHGINVANVNGLLFNGAFVDGSLYVTNLYRLSANQPTWQFVSVIDVNNGSFVDISPDAAIAGNAQLTPQRDQPPIVLASYGNSPYNYAAIKIYKGRIWVYAIVQNESTNRIPQVQLWFSNVGRPWEFDQLTQVLLLDSDIINQYTPLGPGTPVNYSSFYGNDPLDMGVVGSWLLPQSKRQTWAIIGDDASTFVARQIFPIGIVSRHSGTDVLGGRFWLSENGPYFFDGSAPKYIGEEIRGYLFSSSLAAATLSAYDQVNSCGYFSNMVWYLAFPTRGFGFAYDVVSGEWLSQNEYIPAAPAAVVSTPSDPTIYSANGMNVSLNAVIAARWPVGGTQVPRLDWLFADPDNDLGSPQTCSWSGPVTHSAKPSYEKQYRFLTVDVPPGTKGSLEITLMVDGTAYDFAIADLSTTTRHIASLSGPNSVGELRGFMAQLQASLTGVAGQPAPQVWGVTIWGQTPPERNLQIPI